MMKKIVFALLFLSSAFAFAQKHKLPDGQQIKQVLRMQQSAWNNGDIKEFMQGYWHHDSLMFIGKKGITKGWQQTFDNYVKSYPDKATMGELQFDILSVELFSKSTAQVIGKWNLKRGVEKGDIGGHFTLILKKINGKWLIVSDHTS